jgi:uncharacterized membrane protein YkvA (DUF1232 family)
MRTQIIRSKISDTVANEKRTGKLAALIREFARAQGENLKTAEINDAVAFIQEYVEHVPALLEATALAAQQAGIDGQVMPVLEVVEEYFLNPHDLIPDHLGLGGLMDDAYFALSLIQSISDSYQQMTGSPLIPIDLRPANSSIRVIIGEPLASQLDMGIAAALQVTTIQQGLEQLMAFGGTMPVEDPIWGRASIDDIVNTRLGAMGVV